jgi:hypothetical protein
LRVLYVSCVTEMRSCLLQHLIMFHWCFVGYPVLVKPYKGIVCYSGPALLKGNHLQVVSDVCHISRQFHKLEVNLGVAYTTHYKAILKCSIFGLFYYHPVICFDLQRSIYNQLCWRPWGITLIHDTQQDVTGVGKAIGYGLNDWGVEVRVPVGSSPSRPDRLWGPPSVLSNG